MTDKKVCSVLAFQNWMREKNECEKRTLWKWFSNEGKVKDLYPIVIRDMPFVALMCKGILNLYLHLHPIAPITFWAYPT